ncbi:hypothetical protein CWI39_0596p0020 [Hamiltosporidium magnivora]|uniref:Uncharacterized protein n=1 Tax=Hamiltosporidium magnivora TaxID=148818 RepID=A0A4Q9LD82_9MICR|nr:hypothetical protein CWI39_0596p0020 [Hamiltosporidium magnivora]
MHFQRVMYKFNCILILFLLLTCKSSSILRDKKRKASEIQNTGTNEPNSHVLKKTELPAVQMQEKFVALHPNPVTHHPTDSHFSKNQGTILDQGEAKTCLRVESTHKKPYSSYKIDDGSNFGDNSSFSTPEIVSHKISKNNNAPCLVYSHFISIDSPPEKLSSLELKNLLNHISNYSENMAIPDISIILDIDVLFDDILKKEFLTNIFCWLEIC